MKKIVTLFCTLLISIFASANDRFVEHKDWQTIETENFRVHFTPEYRDWAVSAANELEKSRQLINDQQGRVVVDKVDAVVFDPFNGANGYAIPLENKPFTGLFVTPPQSDSIISNSSSWQQLLVLHEYVHLVHLTQPERSVWRNRLGKIWDIYDITSIDTPRWAIEGYATLLESKTTGRGRLFNNQVEAILKQFAREGALPTYEQLSSSEGGYLAGSMAYLVGARYLYWLENKFSEQTLDDVWPRLRAKKDRDFNEAFTGIFRQSPKKLYQRFAAEYTTQAIMSEREATKSDPHLWLDTKDGTSAPTISPDGDMMVLVQRDNDGNSTLNIYSLDANQEAKDDFEKEQKELIKQDPLDIPDNPPTVYNPERLHTLYERNYMRISDPRWVSSDVIIFNTLTRNSEGEMHRDIARWHIPSGKVTHLTKAQNLRRFDVLENGSNIGENIVAERNRYGKSQLIKMNLKTGQIEELTPASLDIIYDFPRVNPTKPEQLAYVSTKLNESWQLQIVDMNTGKGKTVPAPKGYQFLSYPSWSPNGEKLYFVAGQNEQLAVYSYSTDTETLEQITQGKQVVGWPVVTKNNDLYVLSTNSQGPDVHKLSLANAQLVKVTDTTSSAQLADVFDYEHQLAPAIYDLNDEGMSEQEYGIGPQEITATVAASFNASSFDLIEVGARGGDVLQRLTWQINASESSKSDGLSGLSASARWQGWPVKITANAYDVSLNPSRQDDPQDFQKQSFKGGALWLEYPYQYDTLTLTPFVKTTFANGAIDEQTWQLGWQQSWYLNKRVWGVYQSTKGAWLEGESETINDNDLPSKLDWSGYDFSVLLGAQFYDFSLQTSARFNKRNDIEQSLINLGGFSSTLFNKEAHANRQFAPELGFNAIQSNDIRYFELATMHRNMPFSIIYGRYDFDAQNNIDVYGLKGQFTSNAEVLGASDLVLDFGLLQVNPDNQKSELKTWVGMSYQF